MGTHSVNVAQLEPELYLRLTTPRRVSISDADLDNWAADLDAILVPMVAQRIELDPQSLKLRITLRRGSIEINIAIIGGLWLLLAKYGSVRTGAVSLSQDIATLWRASSRAVRKTMSSVFPKTRVTEREIRRGWLEQLDAVISKRRNQELSENEFLNEALDILQNVRPHVRTSEHRSILQRFLHGTDEEAIRFLAQLELNQTEGEPQRLPEMPQLIFRSSLAPAIDRFLSCIDKYIAIPESQTLYELDLASRSLAYESAESLRSRIGDRSAYVSDIAFALVAYDRLRAVLQHVHLDTTDTLHAESIVSNAQVLRRVLVLHSVDHELSALPRQSQDRQEEVPENPRMRCW